MKKLKKLQIKSDTIRVLGRENLLGVAGRGNEFVTDTYTYCLTEYVPCETRWGCSWWC